MKKLALLQLLQLIVFLCAAQSALSEDATRSLFLSGNDLKNQVKLVSTHQQRLLLDVQARANTPLDLETNHGLTWSKSVSSGVWSFHTSFDRRLYPVEGQPLLFNQWHHRLGYSSRWLGLDTGFYRPMGKKTYELFLSADDSDHQTSNLVKRQYQALPGSDLSMTLHPLQSVSLSGGVYRYVHSEDATKGHAFNLCFYNTKGRYLSKSSFGWRQDKTRGRLLKAGLSLGLQSNSKSSWREVALESPKVRDPDVFVNTKYFSSIPSWSSSFNKKQLSVDELWSEVKILENNRYYRIGDQLMGSQIIMKDRDYLMNDNKYRNTFLQLFLLQGGGSYRKSKPEDYRSSADFILVKHLIDTMDLNIKGGGGGDLVIYFRNGDNLIKRGKFNGRNTTESIIKYAGKVLNGMVQHKFDAIKIVTAVNFHHGCSEVMFEESKRSFFNLIHELKKYGLPINVVSNDNPDTDFLYMVRSSHFLNFKSPPSYYLRAVKMIRYGLYEKYDIGGNFID